MTISTEQNPNHPKKGSSIKVEPIREKKAINEIKQILQNNPRNFCLFTLGINTALKASELLALKAGDVRYTKVGDAIKSKQSKVWQDRKVVLNQTSVEAIQLLLNSVPYTDDDYLFKGQRGLLTIPTVTNLVKKWCENVGLVGNYGSRSLRKTWGYWQRMRGIALPLLMDALGHSSQKQTLDYLCLKAEEFEDIYMMEL